jgi:hypothetical protein
MKITVFITLALLSLQTANGQLVNGSLENTGGTFAPNGDGFMELSTGSTALPGWTVVSDSISWLPNANPWGLSTPSGSMFVDLTGAHDDGSFGGISQTIITVPSQTYRLSLSLGSQQNDPAFSGPMSVMVSAGASSQSFTFSPSGSGNQWGVFSFDFVATSSSTLLTVVGTGSGGGKYLGLDNLQVQAVPEPATLLFPLGGLLLVCARRGKSDSKSA